MKLRNKKTGEIVDDAQYRNYSYNNGFGFRTPEKDYKYKTLARFVDEWEDYIPPKPLIEDEKIRKAIRAWAEALDLRWFRRCSSTNSYTSRLSGHNAEGVCYTMEFGPNDLYGERITENSYTLEELCGSEND